MGYSYTKTDQYVISQNGKPIPAMTILSMLEELDSLKETVKHHAWRAVEDGLPHIDQYVLWLFENGFMFFGCIDKDWDEAYLKWFLDGCGHKETNGRIIKWMIPPEDTK